MNTIIDWSYEALAKEAGRQYREYTSVTGHDETVAAEMYANWMNLTFQASIERGGN